MKGGIKIVIDTKDTRKMCSEKKRLSEGCATCFSEIQELVSNFLASIEEKDNKQRATTEKKDNEQRSRMADEWAIFLTNAEDKLDTSILHSEKETDKLNTNSKWILTIVLGIAFCLGAAVGMIYKEVTQKADRDKVMTKAEMKMIYDITKAYNADQFLQNPNAKVDSTNVNWVIKGIFSGAMRSGN